MPIAMRVVTESSHRYVQELEERAKTLREALQAKPQRSTAENVAPTKIAGHQRHNASLKGNRRYIGVSSGITFIESAITFAKTHGILEDLQDLESNGKAFESPESKRLLQILSPGPAQATLDRETVSDLFDYFLATHWTYRILTPDDFDVHVVQYFSMTPEKYPESATVIHAVCAISTFFLGMTEGNIVASNLAEVHYEKALSYLTSILSQRSIQTLQIILLVLLYSLLNPQKPVTWHLLGSALRLATFLGLHNENYHAGGDEKDRSLRQHLFWSLYSIDRAVGNTLGRPTALQDVDIQVPLPHAPQDRPSDSSKTFNTAIANHCFRLRQLQSEVADTLYQKIKPMPMNYIVDIQQRLDEWLSEAPMSEASPQVQEWINHAYHNLTMFINRPGLITLTPLEGTHKRSFDSASKVLRLYARMYQRNSIDCTWMAFHWLFLAAITHLFCLWIDIEIRSDANWQEVNEDLQTTRMVLSAMVERWRSGKKTLAVYSQLCQGTLRRFTQMKVMMNTSEEPQQDVDIPKTGRANFSDDYGFNEASMMSEHLEAPMGDTSMLHFEDTLMEDEPDYWLNSSTAGFITGFTGAAGADAEFGAIGNELDPWVYHT